MRRFEDLVRRGVGHGLVPDARGRDLGTVRLTMFKKSGYPATDGSESRSVEHPMAEASGSAPTSPT